MRRMALIAGLLFAATVRAESFFGIELGAPFAISECKASDFVPSTRSGTSTCEIRREAITRPWGSIEHSIRIVGQSDPHGISGINATEYQGVVVDVEATTYGADIQAQLLRDLTAKFGTPSSQWKNAVQNAFGVRYPAIVATWNKPGLTVKFNGVTDSLEHGEITVTTARGREESRVADAWRAKNMRSSM